MLRPISPPQPNGLPPLTAAIALSSLGAACGKAIRPSAWSLPAIPQRGIPPCSACHGPAASKLGAPALQGQHAAYIERQLAAFAQGMRQNDIYRADASDRQATHAGRDARARRLLRHRCRCANSRTVSLVGDGRRFPNNRLEDCDADSYRVCSCTRSRGSPWAERGGATAGAEGATAGEEGAELGSGAQDGGGGHRRRPSGITGAASSRSSTTEAGSILLERMDHAAMTACGRAGGRQGACGGALQEAEPGAGGGDQPRSLRGHNGTRLHRNARGASGGGRRRGGRRHRRELRYAEHDVQVAQAGLAALGQ